METLGHFSQTYGKFEARIWFPPGPGIWPAFWLEGTNITRVGWPQCGEIDVDEPFNRNTHLVLGYAHTKKIRWRARLTVSKPTTAGFHTYGITWTPKGISWTFDGHTYSSMKATPGWGFNHRFFMILNVAIGGNYPGPISKTNKYPATMIVAWVKVYHQVHTTSAAN
jgi:beta-glucanase (GH16 family)